MISDEIASLFILVLPVRNAYKEFWHQEIRIEYKGKLSGDKMENRGKPETLSYFRSFGER